MFIPLHHKQSGLPFFLPIAHILFIDTRAKINKLDVKGPTENYTVIQTAIAAEGRSLAFEVQETAEEVSELINEKLFAAARLSS